MRILVVHAWLKGNLGDVLQLSVLLSALRELNPRVLDLAGYPAQPADETAEVVARADRYLPDPFIWYWKALPEMAERLWLEPRWRRRRAALFSRYDAIVCAPGPYLASYDARAPSALSDIHTASDIGRPIVLSSHSIGPLSSHALSAVARATTRVARETSTHAFLSAGGIDSVQSADYAFLYPYATSAREVPGRSSRRLIFLRSNNLGARALRIDNGALFDGPRMLADAAGDPMVLTTSDYRRDEPFLRKAAKRLDLSYVPCRSVPDLIGMVSSASRVVSDRYHPAICAAVLGKPAQVVLNREPHKMEGLSNLLSDRSLGELQDLARAGLHAVQNGVRSHV